MANLLFDIESLYRQQFGSMPYKIGNVAVSDGNDAEVYKLAQDQFKKPFLTSNLKTTDLMGVEVWMPTYFDELPEEIGNNGRLFLPYGVVRVTGSSNIIRTPLAERIGTVKELYSIDDYKITFKGFFIDKENNLFPQSDIEALKKIHELGRAFKMYNPVTNIFLEHEGLIELEQNRVVITSFELPEVEGGRNRVRPFVMQLESDTVFKLEVE